jgi:predicted transcriptional regulator
MNQPPTNQDVPQDPSLDEYHRSLIEEGIRECDAGEMLEHEVLMRMAANWVKKPRAR